MLRHVVVKRATNNFQLVTQNLLREQLHDNVSGITCSYEPTETLAT